MSLPALKTIKCKIEAIYPSSNDYKILIIMIHSGGGYMPITIPFNYSTTLSVGKEGILTYEEALAGETEWYDKLSDRYYKHNYTAYYFKHFVPIETVNDYANAQLIYT